MRPRQVVRLLAGGENDQVEFKSRIEPIARDVCAFLNSGGGTVLCGVSDDGDPVGVPKKDAAQRVADALQKIDPAPAFSVSTVAIDGRTIVAVQLEASPHLHAVGNVAYVRLGANNRPLSIPEVLERASESLFLYFDEQPSPVPAEEVDEGSVQRFLDERARIRGVQPRGTLEDNLLRLKIVTTQHGRQVLTYAGALMFAQHPERHLAHARVSLVRFSDHARQSYSDSRQFSGRLPDVIDAIEAYFASTLREIGGHLEGFRRRRLREYPLVALREAIVNALAHRNYLDPADTKVFVLPGEIRIKNPGSFPPGVTAESPEHKPRNPLLTGFLYDLGYVERYGFGIARMREACAEHPLVSVDFELGPRRTEVVFRQKAADLDLDQADRDALELLGRGPVPSRDLVARLGMSRQSVNVRMRRLMDLSLVEREGKGRSTHYRLK